MSSSIQSIAQSVASQVSSVVSTSSAAATSSQVSSVAASAGTSGIGAIQLIASIVLLILSIILVIVVLMQPGKSARLPGTIAGGADQFLDKNKARTVDAMLARWTKVIAILFVVLTVVVSLLSLLK